MEKGKGEFNQEELYREELEAAGPGNEKDRNFMPEDPKEKERNKPPAELNPVLLQKLLPILTHTSKNSQSLTNASKENVKLQMETLKICLEKDISIAGGILDMDTGRVEFFA